jgi:thiamine-phosphate pyrophosphorylase
MKHLKGFAFHGLYAITDAEFKSEALAAQVELAIQGGARVIQYRDKSDDTAQRLAESEAILAVCRHHNIPLLINDDIELAAHIGAHGVHLGRDDAALAAARERLGESAIIGVSCYNRFELAQAAEAAGADYIAFGRFFSSGTKPQAAQAAPELLQRARAELHCPVVAIGGITPDNGAQLIQAGADMLAVIRGVFAADDVTQAAQSLQKLFEPDVEKNP